MKKIVLALLLTFLGTIQAYADQYSDNPSRYFAFTPKFEENLYIDKSSVKAVSSTSTFYVIDAEQIKVIPKQGVVYKTIYRFMYDVDARTISSVTSTMSIYGTNGKFINEIELNSEPEKITVNDFEWYVADYVYYVANGKSFSLGYSYTTIPWLNEV